MNCTVRLIKGVGMSAAFAIACLANAATVADFGAIDMYVAAQRVALNIPGLAIGIVADDGTIHAAGFGQADAAGRAVTGDTPFILGSTSKSFTALAIMQLVEAGRIDLEAPVQRYLPWFRVADERTSAAITVRQLLNHTSGISTAAGRRTLTDFDASADALERRVRDLRTVALSAAPGATFQYSNCNYQVLGLIVQQVTGASYEAYVAQHIVAPLVMTDTFTSKAAAADHGLALGHSVWFGHPVAYDEPLPRASIPQGFIVSSARDMARYLGVHLHGGSFGNVSILSNASMAQLHRGTARAGDGGAFYAMGWNAGTIDGTRALWHGGDTFSFQSFMVLQPDTGRGVVLTFFPDIGCLLLASGATALVWAVVRSVLMWRAMQQAV